MSIDEAFPDFGQNSGGGRRRRARIADLGLYLYLTAAGLQEPIYVAVSSDGLADGLRSVVGQSRGE